MKVTVDGVTLGGMFDATTVHVDDQGVEWVLTTLNGWWGSPGTKTRRTDRATGPGAYRAASYKGVRTMELGGVFTALNQDPYLMTRASRQLAAMCSDPADLYELVVQDPVSPTCAYVELDGDLLTELRDNLRYSMRFSVQLASPDPRKFNRDWTTSTAPERIIGTGGIIATTPGILATGTGIVSGTSDVIPAVTAYGQGTTDNPVVLQVIGPTEDFNIVNTSGGTTIGYHGRLAPGQSLYINLDSLPAYGVPGAREPIVGHGAIIERTNARAAVSVRGGWPRLLPGGQDTYVISGSLGYGSALVVHSRGAWL